MRKISPFHVQKLPCARKYRNVAIFETKLKMPNLNTSEHDKSALKQKLCDRSLAPIVAFQLH